MMKKKIHVNGFIILLLVYSLMFVVSSSVSAEDAVLKKTDSFDEFSKEVINLIKENKPLVNGGAAAGNEFYSRRLIVKGKSASIDFRSYNPTSVIQGLDNIYILQFATSGAAENAMHQLSNLSEIIYAEPDSYIGAEAADTKIPGTKSHSWGVADIGADEFIKQSLGNTAVGINVAVVDSGVANHPFLANRLKQGFDFVDNDDNPDDLNGHGTHVAGIIVDCTPGLNVNIMPVRVLDGEGRGQMLTAGLGIRYAADHGASIINLSLGGRHSSFMDDSISYALEKNVTVVVAAGNSHGDTAHFCPAHMDNVIVVGAVDSNLRKAGFSNTGKSLDVVAPGVDIVSSVPGGGFASMSGTSMAAPHVSALAAMFRLQNPQKKPAGIEQMIKNRAEDLGKEGFDNSYGFGFARSKKVLSPIKVTLSKSSLSLNVGKTKTLKAAISPLTAKRKLTWKSSDTKVATVKNGQIEAKNPGRTIITVKTANGISATCKVTVSKPQNPKKVTLKKEKLKLKTGESATLKATVSPNGAIQKLTWESSDKNVATVKNGKIKAKNPGEATITVKTVNGKTDTCKVVVVKKQGNSEAVMSALKTYKKVLEKKGKNTYFFKGYFNSDNIPDMITVSGKDKSTCTYYINGLKAADSFTYAAEPEDSGTSAAGGEDLFTADEGELFGEVPEDLLLSMGNYSYFYFPRKNLVMSRYESTDVYKFYWEEYGTFISCHKYGYKFALSEFLVKSQGEDEAVPQYTRISTSDKDCGNGYDDMLDKWIKTNNITDKKFKKLLAATVGNVKIQEIKFVRNTEENRKKYLK